MTEFLSKATGTAVDWVQMPGMKVSYFSIPCYKFGGEISGHGQCFRNLIGDRINEKFGSHGSMVQPR